MNFASLALGFVVGGLLVITYVWLRGRLRGQSLHHEAQGIVKAAKLEREHVLRTAEIDAKEIVLRLQQENEREVKAARDNLNEAEKRVRQRETQMEHKVEHVERQERELKKREALIDAAASRTEKMLDEAHKQVERAKHEIERVAGLSQDEAKAELVESLSKEAKRAAAESIRRIEMEARAHAQDRATKIIAESIQRLASGFVSEKTVSVVELPSDEMKGRIIGREGRNIRAIEAATGVDIIIDDTPEVVVISGFNPVRREIAKMALERLIDDGRIHPARIEEVVEQCALDMDEVIVRAGEQATFDLGLHGMHPELIKLIGRLKFRTVNGQNVWNHSIETAVIAGMMASELGLDATLARRAGLLHDIGKATSHEVDGSHPNIAAEFARKFGEKPDVVEAVRRHHESEPGHVLAVLVQAADTLSKARPGARQDLLESYIKRLEEFERLSLSFPGVEKAYALQAGREVRVMVDYAQVGADEAVVLSRDIARRIEEQLTYPGEVRIMVIREARATEIAR